MTPPPWVADLRADLAKDLGHKPKVAALATVGADQTAEVRSVVVRQIDDDGSLTFTSDGRSRKVAEVMANAAATVLFWLPTLKRQYRIAGAVAILARDHPRTAEQWRAASDNARAMFFWPPPGEPRADGAAFASAVPAETAMPESFAVLVLSPRIVERLDLTQTPHLRQRWEPAGGGWGGAVVNP